MFSLPMKIINELRTKGFNHALGHALNYILNVYYERCFGIFTTDHIYLSELGFDNSDSLEYVPTDFVSLRKLMDKVGIEKGDVFLDYGSGMGRVLIIAALYPFRKVIGVEMSSKLNAIAAQNIEKVRNKLKCKRIDINESDAAEYKLPNDVTVIYFFNPFKGATLSTVLDNIEESINRFPRELTIIYKNPPYFEKQASSRYWLKKRFDYKPFYGHRYVVYDAEIHEIRHTRKLSNGNLV